MLIYDDLARLWMAIGVPPSRGIEKNAITVHQTLAKVSAAAMFNLHKRNQDIQVTVEKSHDELEKQSNKLEKLNRQNEILMDAYDRLYESYQSFRHDVESMIPRAFYSGKHADQDSRTRESRWAAPSAVQANTRGDTKRLLV